MTWARDGHSGIATALAIGPAGGIATALGPGIATPCHARLMVAEGASLVHCQWTASSCAVRVAVVCVGSPGSNDIPEYLAPDVLW